MITNTQKETPLTITQSLKDVKYNLQPLSITLIVKKQPDKNILLSDFFIENNPNSCNPILANKSDDLNFLIPNTSWKDINLDQEKELCNSWLQENYNKLIQMAENNHKNFQTTFDNMDIITLLICTMINIEHVSQLQLIFYDTFFIQNTKFDDGTDETFAYLNMMFDMNVDLEKLQDKALPFAYPETEQVCSQSLEDIKSVYSFVQENLNKKIMMFPYGN